MLNFVQTQRQRCQTGELNAAELAGVTAVVSKPMPAELIERAAWASLARGLLSLDEAITRN